MTDPTGMCGQFGDFDECARGNERTDPHYPLDTGGGGDTTVGNRDLSTITSIQATFITSGLVEGVLENWNSLDEGKYIFFNTAVQDIL